MAKPMWAGFVSAIVLALICTGIYAFVERSDVAQATPGEVDPTVGVDANPAGNTATSLSTINSCISVESVDTGPGVPGPTFSIDLVIQDVMNLKLWDGTFRFDESLLEVNALDVNDFFLGNHLWGPIFDCDAGQCQVGTFDTTGAGHDGEGVLGRLEITAIGPGISKANFNTRPDFPTSGVTLEDENGTDIEPVDEHGYFDGTILDAEIRVDQPCPGNCEEGVDTDLDGFDDDVECYLETDQDDGCPNNPSHDAWPLDIDMDTSVSVSGDVYFYVGMIGSPVTDPSIRRLDLDMSGDISITGDVFEYVGRIGETCS